MRAPIFAALLFIVVTAGFTHAEEDGKKSAQAAEAPPSVEIGDGGIFSDAKSETLIHIPSRSPENPESPQKYSNLEGFYTRDLFFRIGEDDQAGLFTKDWSRRNRDLLHRREEDGPHFRTANPLPEVGFPSQQEMKLPQMRILPELLTIPGMLDEQ